MVIGKALTALCDEQSYNAYRSLETLYYFLVPDVQDDLKTEHDALQAKIRNALQTQGADTYDANHKQSKAIEKIISQEVYNYLNHLVRALHAHHLLIEEWGAKPKFGNEGRL